jgi:hypothetical protein
MNLSYYSECGIFAKVDFKISSVNRQVSKALSLAFDAFRGTKKFLLIFLISFCRSFEMIQLGTSLQPSNFIL